MKTRTCIIIFSTILSYLINCLVYSYILTRFIDIEFTLMLCILIIITSILAPFGLISIYKGFSYKFLYKLDVLGQKFNKKDVLNVYKTITIYSFVLSLISYSIPLMYDGMEYTFSYIVMKIVIITILYSVFGLIYFIRIYKQQMREES